MASNKSSKKAKVSSRVGKAKKGRAARATKVPAAPSPKVKEPTVPGLDEQLDAEAEALPVPEAFEPRDPVDALITRLPRRQQIFVAEFMANGGNATQAGIVAGYSKATADSQASRLLKDVKVAAVIDAWTASVLSSKKVTAEGVLDELRKIARFDPRKMFRPDGTLVPIDQLDDETAAAIAGVEVREITVDNCVIGYLKKIKIADKIRANELLGKNLKIFTDKVEHSGMLGVQLIHDVPRPLRAKK